MIDVGYPMEGKINMEHDSGKNCNATKEYK